jgi:2-oxoglutarate/2-oxoacid ferredoxin oxidoreductase subunit alpha
MEQKRKNVIVRIAGAAGDGIASSGELFGKTCSRMGLHVMAYNAYQSAIRGGHVWLQLNVGEDKTLSHGEEPDFALLLNKTSPDLHVPMMKSGGTVFYDASVISEDIKNIRADVHYYGLNFKELVTIEGASPVMKNTMLVGALIQALGLDTSVSHHFLEDKFAKKGSQTVEINKKVFDIGATWAGEHVTEKIASFRGDGISRMFLTGNDAFGMGFMAGGLKFYAAYPMSPATGILHYLATKAQSDKMVIKQTEDELAAINYIVGAAHAGVRAATATAGGGFCLMVEGVGLAAMLEVPVVAVVVQRGSPSTGIPTKQEQADINLVLSGNGDFPKIVIAPKDTEDAFFQAARALNLAEKYQTPVIILSDLFLSEHYQTVDPFNFDEVKIERGKLMTEFTDSDRYKRYEYQPDGISPRLRPGVPGQMYVTPSDEHDERGIVISDVLAGLPESLETRNKMHQKRMQKEITMVKTGDIELPVLVGDKNARITLLGWGSTYDAIQEAVQMLNAEGLSVNHLHFTDLYPINKAETRRLLESCQSIISVENNYSNQLCSLIRKETGFDINRHVNRYDGEPFTGEYIVSKVKEKELAHA